MNEVITADICIIGAGSGGLSVASGAAQLGKSTILVEGGKMGGDCLNGRFFQGSRTRPQRDRRYRSARFS